MSEIQTAPTGEPGVINPPTVHNADTFSLINVIEKIATNPDADVNKLEKMLDMQERILDRQAAEAFNISMTKAQSNMGRIAADAANPQTRSKYASYAAIDRVLRPIYTENGFSLSFGTGETEKADTVRVLCYVGHIAGHVRTYHVDMPADGKGAKGGDVMTKTHAAGAAMQYGMRYLVKLIFNIAVGEDDDGNAASAKPTISDKQCTELQAMCTDAGMDKAKTHHYLGKLAERFGITMYTDIHAENFEAAREILKGAVKAWLKKQGAENG